MGTEGKKVAEASRLSFSEDQRRDASATFSPAPNNAAGSTSTGSLTPEGATHLPMVPLGQIAAVKLGKMLDRSKHKTGRELRYLRNINVRWGSIETSDLLEMFFKDAAEEEKYSVRPGDVLVCEGGEPGRAAVWAGGETELKYQKALHRVRFNEPYEPKLLVYFLEWMASTGRLEEFFTGSTIKHFTRESFIGLPVPNPPLPEQRRIVARIEELFSRLDAGVAALRHAKAQLQRYRQSVLAAAVTGELTREWREQHPDTEPASTLLKRVLDQRRNEWLGKGKYKDASPLAEGVFAALPPEWAIASLEALTDANRPICYGILMPKDNVPDGVLYVKVRDMRGDRINLESLQRTTPEIAARYERAALKEGDLLLSIRGTYGRVALIPPELDGGNITQDSARLAVSELLSRDYVACAIRSHAIQTHFKNVARGVAVKGVNIGDVKPTPIPIPPLAEQHQIVAEVEARTTAIDHLEAELNRQISRSNRLRRSVLAEAFRGGLS